MSGDFSEFLRRAGQVAPSARQAEWFDTEFYAFVHFTVNTYTDLEWGLGNESESLFCPTELDCDQWVSSVKAAGARGLVLTAKHHDGFCLWPSRYTEHSVKNSPWKEGKGDVVREAAEACRRGGIKFGVYLSPWDRNASCYGTPAYNDYYCAQLTELLTEYGELFLVWQDGACGEGPNGKKQIYDFDRYNALIRKYQPNACIFHDQGPDVRWCGNESGTARTSEWAVVPSELCIRSRRQTDGPFLSGALPALRPSQVDLGSLSSILYSKGLTFTGAEIDMSIRPGWFWHQHEEPHSLQRLFDTYLRSVGGNACFHLNVPPMPNGRLDPRDVQRLRELGDALHEAFGCRAETDWKPAPETGEGQRQFLITVPAGTALRYVSVMEDITQGQRVESWRLLDGEAVVCDGTTIGHKRIARVKHTMCSDTLTLEILASRGTPILRDIAIYR